MIIYFSWEAIFDREIVYLETYYMNCMEKEPAEELDMWEFYYILAEVSDNKK